MIMDKTSHSRDTTNPDYFNKDIENGALYCSAAAVLQIWTNPVLCPNAPLVQMIAQHPMYLPQLIHHKHIGGVMKSRKYVETICLKFICITWFSKFSSRATAH
jgi:hypothetical protein